MHALWLSWSLFLALTDRTAPVPEFALPDHRGAVRKLGDWRDSKLVVVVFLSIDCPLCKLYAPHLAEMARDCGPRGVAFVGIDANANEAPTAVARYVRAHRLPFPVLVDKDHAVADRLGATRTPQVFVLDERRVVRYRGRIDDRYAVGLQRPKATSNDLADALDELLAGKAVSRPVTEAPGCPVSRAAPAPAREEVTYCRDVAPVLQKRCVACHRPGQVAPFSLTTFRQAAGRAESIQEVLVDGRMPPWHADPKYGHFANDPRPTDAEKQRIFDWIDAGCLEGDPADLPPPATFPDDWAIPPPDAVVTMPRPFTVPATGTVEYQFIEVDPDFREDRWVRFAEVRPGNRKVVHHCTVFLRPPGCENLVEQGTLGSYCLAAWAPGTPPMTWPEGMAKLVPAGWRVVFVIHYVAVGTEQDDQTSIGLVFADPKTVKKEVATKIMMDLGLSIPPRAADHRVEHTWRVNADVLLLAMFPHMHLRGKAFRYAVTYPDGTEEILLDVPRYDFNWQHRYVLAEPKRLPAGSLLRCTASYDNSAGNPANPDPDATVRAGLQTWDEMFNGYFDVALADQDMTQTPPLHATLWTGAQAVSRSKITYAVLAVWAAFLMVRRYARHKWRAEVSTAPGQSASSGV